jgi:hypothetical protein
MKLQIFFCTSCNTTFLFVQQFILERRGSALDKMPVIAGYLWAPSWSFSPLSLVIHKLMLAKRSAFHACGFTSPWGALETKLTLNIKTYILVALEYFHKVEEGKTLRQKGCFQLLMKRKICFSFPLLVRGTTLS